MVGGLRIDRLLAGPRLVLQSFKAVIGIAVPPKADNPRLNADFLGNRTGAAPVRRPQNYPRPASNRAAMSSASDNTPQAPCDLSARGGLLLLRESSIS